MIQLLAGGKAVAFLGGTLVGAVAVPVLKSKTVRKAAVSVLATGISVKEQAETKWNMVQEDMTDLYQEAKSKKEARDLDSLKDFFDLDWDDDLFGEDEEVKEDEEDVEDDLDDLDELF